MTAAAARDSLAPPPAVNPVCGWVLVAQGVVDFSSFTPDAFRSMLPTMMALHPGSYPVPATLYVGAQGLP